MLDVDEPEIPEMPAMEIPIFIVGLPRSGSSLWSNTIYSAGDIMQYGEMHFLHPYRGDFKRFLRRHRLDLFRDSDVTRMLDILFSEEGILLKDRGNFWRQLHRIEPVKLKRRLHNRILGSDRSIGAVFCALVEEATYVRNYSKCLVKFPVYPTYLSHLRKWYPAAKIIHITRDPRAMAMSRTNDPGGTAKLIRKFPFAKWLIKQFMKIFVIVQYLVASRVHVRFKEDRYYALFRYEDLLTNPQEEVARLCRFLDIPFSEALLNPKEGQPSSLTGQKKHGFDREAAFRWKKVMSPLGATLIYWITRKSMARFEYVPDEYFKLQQ